MQKRADDPREVAALARRQERELRAWLFDGVGRRSRRQPRRRDRGCSGRGRGRARRARSTWSRLAIATLDERGAALVAATREALTNAAKFAAEAGAVAVYAEMGPERAQVFVRDRGPGFDPDAVPADRRGRARVDHRQDGTTRGQRLDQLGARRRDRGRAGDGGAGRDERREPSVVIVDDHAIFRSGVRAELEGLVDVRGDAGSVEEAVRLIVERAPGRRSARRPHARRRRRRGDPADRRSPTRRSGSWRSRSPTPPRT